MSNVVGILTFRARSQIVIADRSLKPKIHFKGGIWRVQKSPALNQDAIDANYNAMLFVVHKNQFETGGHFGQKEKG